MFLGMKNSGYVSETGTRPVIGDIPSIEMQHYAKLVEAGISNDFGNRHNIIFDKDYAIKYPHGRKPTGEDVLIKEYLIGNDLRYSGFCAPKMYAVGVTDDKQFLLMERLDIPYSEMNIRAEDLPKQQLSKLKNRRYSLHELGYYPIDVFSNFAWSNKHQNIYFYDFEQWEGQRVDMLMEDYYS